ncbi:helix-turn-helix domain-containing protein [Asticcacaulis sp. AND118]|uniref:helix-turn-helix domain-containing protein n=1 Tax=Asticcacaulis sp. AND118 TaxID=2840468 RepID=UPI001CFFFF48|nr:helix-turn-helix transcriptional regulator [Asticcacaulis sp. AND118]UDF05621.1 helix-turn-helix domain-containing protein [Asticcacaulis sp. AND118]
MDSFGTTLKDRAKALGLSNATVAERAGLDARRYGHYVTGRNEPDLATLVRIARVLKTTPNLLLKFETEERSAKVEALLAAARELNDTQLEMLIDFAEATVRKK